MRWRIDPTAGRLSETMLEERGCEFPRFNDAVAGRHYRYGYTVSLRAPLQFGPAFKHDVTTGRTEIHDYGPGRATQEPVFVAREGATGENDGWILSYVHDAADVVILERPRLLGRPHRHDPPAGPRCGVIPPVARSVTEFSAVWAYTPE